MFKVGDIVWSKVHKYSITFYHRPCKVLKCLGSEMRVQVLDTGRTFVVDAYKFELVPERGILEQGQEISVKGFKNRVIFKKYLSRGQIRITEYDLFYDISIGDVIYLRGFYV